MRNSKKVLLATLLAAVVLLTSCGGKEESYDDIRDLAATTSFSDIVDDIGKLTYLDEYLEDNGYESLVSDYVGFRDSGDYESASKALCQLGRLVFNGSVIDTLYREDDEFAKRVGDEFTLNDLKITSDVYTESGYRGIFVTVDGGENYSEFVKDGKFTVIYGADGLALDMIGTLNSLESGYAGSTLDGLNIAFNFIKEFMLVSGCYSDDTRSIMDGLGTFSENDFIGDIRFRYDSAKVKKIQ